METKDSSGKKVRGVYIIIKDWTNWQPTELAFAMMQLTARWQSPSPFSQAKKSEINLFNKHVGSTAWWTHLETSGNSVDPSSFLNRWDREAKLFRKRPNPSCYIEKQKNIIYRINSSCERIFR